MLHLLFLFGLILILINARKVLNPEAVLSQSALKEAKEKVSQSAFPSAASSKDKDYGEKDYGEKGYKEFEDFLQRVEIEDGNDKDKDCSLKEDDKYFSLNDNENRTENLHEQVYRLTKKGKDNGEIARQLNIGKGEVEFILALRR